MAIKRYGSLCSKCHVSLLKLNFNRSWWSRCYIEPLDEAWALDIQRTLTQIHLRGSGLEFHYDNGKYFKNAVYFFFPLIEYQPDKMFSEYFGLFSFYISPNGANN